jgi:hypothetical protein
MELMAATGDANHYRVGYSGAAFNISTSAGTNDQQVCAYPSTTEVTYHLIDQAGKKLVSITTKSAAVNLPNEWQSPLVSEYHYWKVGAFDTYDGGTTYKLREDPESFAISDIMEVTEEDNTVTTASTRNGRISVYKNGDANGDDVVDIVDATCVVDKVVGKPLSVFIEEVANADGNDVIDIADAVSIVNIITGNTPAQAPRLR